MKIFALFLIVYAFGQLSPQKDSKIFGGRLALAKEHPYIVAITKSQDTTIAECGGSLISPQWILTAAHCFQATESIKDFRFVLGRTNLKSNSLGTVVTASQLFSHPNWREESSSNDFDIALVKLDKPYNSSTGDFSVINVYSGSDVAIGTTVTVSGWGDTGNGGDTFELRTVDMKIQAQSVCELTNDDVLKVCAADTGKDSCQGDSGGPLVVKVNGVNQLYGVVSYGTSRCGVGTMFGVYSNVPRYNQWMQDVFAGRLPPVTSNSTNFYLSLVCFFVLFF